MYTTIKRKTLSTDYIKNLTSIANSQNLVTKTALESTIKLLLIVELDRVQQEREIIVKRIKQGIEAMVANGVKTSCVEIALFEWLKGAKNPKFKEVQALIK